jgi:hypothetical protein
MSEDETIFVITSESTDAEYANAMIAFDVIESHLLIRVDASEYYRLTIRKRAEEADQVIFINRTNEYKWSTRKARWANKNWHVLSSATSEILNLLKTDK